MFTTIYLIGALVSFILNISVFRKVVLTNKILTISDLTLYIIVIITVSLLSWVNVLMWIAMHATGSISSELKKEAKRINERV